MEVLTWEHHIDIIHGGFSIATCDERGVFSVVRVQLQVLSSVELQGILMEAEAEIQGGFWEHFSVEMDGHG